MTNWNPSEIDCGGEFSPSRVRSTIHRVFENEMQEDLKHQNVQKALNLTPEDEERAMDEQVRDWEIIRQREPKDSPFEE